MLQIEIEMVLILPNKSPNTDTPTNGTAGPAIDRAKSADTEMLFLKRYRIMK